jgi:LysM repeat protein
MVLALGVGLAGCGRSAPNDALGDTSGDPQIAGVSITSPDAVVSTVPGAEPGPVATTAPPAAPAAQPAAAARAYTVQPGDTLSKIAGEHGVTIQALAEANGIADVNSIMPGQELTIPVTPVSVAQVGPASTTVPRP